MPKYPSEIFGYPYFNRSEEAENIRERHWCPFVNRQCYKISRLIDIPFGVCSVHIQDEDIAVCPRRFLDKNFIFQDIANHHFGSVNDILVFSEVHLPRTGSFDFVMLKHAPLSVDIEDFIVIEFQTGQTTGTGQLVRGFTDFLKGESIPYQNYGFGVNHYDIWKRTFTQVLNKGIILENWGHKIYWVIQEPVYEYFENRYNLKGIGYKGDNSTIFTLYNLEGVNGRYEIVSTRRTSATIDQLFHAFRNNPEIPSKDEFINVLSLKIRSGVSLNLNLQAISEPKSLDVKRPGSTGRISDDEEDQLSLFDS